ncbi:MAG: Fis family transcriptional regulator [Neisseriaceae bacterium]|nr:Fis family transcriptional regulator [Neisseriaceae bacterium]
MSSSHSLSVLDTCLEKQLSIYFKELGQEQVDDVYDMVVGLVEKKLINIVLAHCNNNCSKAARFLGINRNTLRVKMQQHNIVIKK